MRNVHRIAFAFTIGLLALLAGTASADLVIDQDYQLVSSVRVGRTAYDYTYQVNITNNGPDVQNVTATISSSSVNTTVIDGNVSFGDVSAGDIVAGADTFTIRQNRLYPFDPAVLSWSVQFELAAQVITPEGGEIQGDGDIVLIVPGGATSEPIPVAITQLPESELGAPTPPNTTFLGGATVDIGDNELDDNADISIPAPAGVSDGSVVYLVKVVEYAGQKVFHMVDTAIVQNGMITSQDPAFPGVTTTGDYAFLLWSAGSGWVEGQVSNINTGAAVPGSVVTLSGGYWLDIADENGYYSLPAWAGNFVVNAFDDLTGDFGEKQGFMPYGGATVTTNVEIGEFSGTIRDTLINGDFEDGLTGWVLEGAGDVVSSFGPILPYEGNFMAMISSGDGAIGGSSSAIEQTFTVPAGAVELSLRYNFISEEYPEYVGSEFTDVMNVTLHTPDGSREIAFADVNSANFQPVSGVPCGSGDCTWGQTGWLGASINITEWAGSDDTLTLTVHDVGDTIYDTVVLIDNIELAQLNLIEIDDLGNFSYSNDSIFLTTETSRAQGYNGISFDGQALLYDPNGVGTLNGQTFISNYIDNTWGNRVGENTSINTVYDNQGNSGISPEDGIFEVVSITDEGPVVAGTFNEHAYVFSYDALRDWDQTAISFTDYVDHLVEVSAQYGRIGRLTILTHGTYGTLNLSQGPNAEQEATLTLESISVEDHEHYQQLLRLRNILTEDAHILLFSCRTGGGDNGEAFVRQIANLTNAYVHANPDFTGPEHSIIDNIGRSMIGLETQDWELDLVCNSTVCWSD